MSRDAHRENENKTGAWGDFGPRFARLQADYREDLHALENLRTPKRTALLGRLKKVLPFTDLPPLPIVFRIAAIMALMTVLIAVSVFAAAHGGRNFKNGAAIRQTRSDSASVRLPFDGLSTENAPLIPEELRININAAGTDELTLLPKVGPVLAQRIITEREQNGTFRFPEDLTAVSGIGLKTLESIRPYITLSPSGVTE